MSDDRLDEIVELTRVRTELDVELLQGPEQALGCLPWTSLKKPASWPLKMRNHQRLDWAVNAVNNHPSSMKYVRGWLSIAFPNVYRRSGTTEIPRYDVYFCIDYLGHVCRSENVAAMDIHRSRLCNEKDPNYLQREQATGNAANPWAVPPVASSESHPDNRTSTRSNFMPDNYEGLRKREGENGLDPSLTKKRRQEDPNLPVNSQARNASQNQPASFVRGKVSTKPPARYTPVSEKDNTPAPITSEGQHVASTAISDSASLSSSALAQETPPMEKEAPSPARQKTRSRTNSLAVSPVDKAPAASASTNGNNKRKARGNPDKKSSPSKKRAKQELESEVEPTSTVSEPSGTSAPNGDFGGQSSISDSGVRVRINKLTRLQARKAASSKSLPLVKPEPQDLSVERDVRAAQETKDGKHPDKQQTTLTKPQLNGDNRDEDPIINIPPLSTNDQRNQADAIVNPVAASIDTANPDETLSLTPSSTSTVVDLTDASTNTPTSTSRSSSVPLAAGKPPISHGHPLKTPRRVKIEEAVLDGLLTSFDASPSDLQLHNVDMTDAPVSSSEPMIENECVPQYPRRLMDFLPPIWSESRQELCESYDWFRSYQGGVYFTGGFVKGYLLSAFGAKRDFYKHDGKLIVSHGGGRAESLHSTKGNSATVQASDQLANDKSVRALRNNYLRNQPLALVIDDRYPFFPYELAASKVTYAVLGFYTIAHMWAEYQNSNNDQGRVVRYKFAFRWCENQGTPWWSKGSNETAPSVDPPNDTLHPSQDEGVRPIEPALILKSCPDCQEESKQVYSLCWVCLNPDCKKFWRQKDGSYLPEQLSYHPGFLVLPPSHDVPHDFKLKPVYPIPSDVDEAKTITVTAPTNYTFTRGFHCLDCGRLSCRSKWEKWQCMACGNSLTILGDIRRAKEFWGRTVTSTGHRDSFISDKSDVESLPARKFDIGTGFLGSVQTFVLPHNRGKIHHIQPGSPMGSAEADKIFEDYQRQATNGELLFRRWPLRAHKCRGTLLTNYFSQNTGQPYQYVGGDANTVPFDTAPSAVIAARDLMQSRVEKALSIKGAVFNEVLSAAYMEKQKMAFHSDNEVGLGPLVAGLSMGATAMMHFRLNSKHDPERRQRGILMSFTLRHGDILVMDGSGVQEYYEHTVVPTNFRIAATARQITPAHR